MSELRLDPVGRRWVIVAGERGHRPSDFETTRRERGDDEPCPFCSIADGDGDATRILTRDVGDDRVVVCANAFPALRVEGALRRAAMGPYDRVSGTGAHEVVIETRHHESRFEALPTTQIAATLLAWRDRLRDLRKDRRLHHFSVFKNAGPEAGATLVHAHSQILASPVRPEQHDRELRSAREHYERHARCLFCDVVAWELEAGDRVVDVGERFVTFAPYAGALPFELAIYPRDHAADFATLSEADADALAATLKRTLRRLARALRGADYNLSLHTAPSAESFGLARQELAGAELFWHWRLAVVPRMGPGFGGYEIATGTCINPTPPEDAAAHLRTLD